MHNEYVQRACATVLCGLAINTVTPRPYSAGEGRNEQRAPSSTGRGADGTDRNTPERLGNASVGMEVYRPSISVPLPDWLSEGPDTQQSSNQYSGETRITVNASRTVVYCIHLVSEYTSPPPSREGALAKKFYSRPCNETTGSTPHNNLCPGYNKRDSISGWHVGPTRERCWV